MKNFLPKISFSNLKGDTFGGITAGIVALPLALAFGVQSGLGASAGIYGAIFLGIIAALFGGTPSQISGPTGPMTVVSASIVGLAVSSAGSLEQGFVIVIGTFFLTGIFQIMFGIIKIGNYIKFIPYPVISGFMSGIGVIIILLQLYPFMGHVSPNAITDVIYNIQKPVAEMNYSSLLLGLGTIVIIYIFPYISKKIPGTLVALLAMTLLAAFGNIEVPIIGSIPAGFPEFTGTAFAGLNIEMIGLMIMPAITLAGLGAIDSLLTSVVADNITKTKHDSNKELIGQGMGNAVAALFGGIPGAGATMRTVVNVRTGGRTQLSGAIHGVLLLVIMLGLGRYVSAIPLSVLAGVLITVGISIIDKKGLKDILHIPKADAVIMIIVLLMTVFVDLLQAVGLGMIIASVLFMKKASDLVDTGTEVTSISHKDHELPWDDECDVPPGMKEEVFIQHLNGPIFFGSVSKFQQMTSYLPENVKVVVIRMKKVPYIDQSGLYAMESYIHELHSKGIKIVFTMIQPQPMYMLRGINIIPGMVPEEKVFDDFDRCKEWFKERSFAKG
ncbi:MAG: SulP family inorganic anion transporter [Bacteroidales bacterium]|nr:SulP family inorganic anion transporter [Bacteroidales bacterium]